MNKIRIPSLIVALVVNLPWDLVAGFLACLIGCLVVAAKYLVDGFVAYCLVGLHGFIAAGWVAGLIAGLVVWLSLDGLVACLA